MPGIVDKLTVTQGMFFKAAIWDTYQVLGLKDLLAAGKSLEEISVSLGLLNNPLKRFLNAAASIGLVIKNANNKYKVVADAPSYSDESSVTLFWLIRNKVFNRIEGGHNTKEKLTSELGGEAEAMLVNAYKHELVQFNGSFQYENISALKPYVLTEGDRYIGPRIIHYEHVMYPMYSVKGIMGALKTGRSQWREIFGEAVSTPFDIYNSQPALLEDFTHGLHRLNDEDNAILAEMFHLDLHTVLDIGGGSGAWAIALLNSASVRTRINIYELPNAIPLLATVFHKYISEHENRINFVPGSFIAESNSIKLQGLNEDQKYDLVTMGWILHDWNDETCIKILRKVRSHLKPAGKLVSLEALLPASKIGPASILDLAMLLQTEGCERTLEEYENLFRIAGFKEFRHIPTTTRRQVMLAGDDISNLSLKMK